MSFPGRRAIRFALFLGLAVSPLFAAKPLDWTVVKTPYFTVLTTGKAAEAQAWATDLERLRIALGMFMPVNKARLDPVVMVIFPNAKQFTPYKMLEKGRPALVDGYFVRGDSINAIGLSGGAADPYRVKRIIFHEATHWYSSARKDVLPVWLEEGLAEVFSTFVASDNGFAIGAVIKDHVQYLQYAGVPKPDELVGATREKMDFNDTNRTGLFYAGSWLMVHWVMFGENAPGAKSLARYVKLLKTGETQDSAFATAFGGNYRTVEKALYQYVQSGHYATPKIRGPMQPPGIEAPRKATEAEVEYALGALLLGTRGPKDSLPHLLRASELDTESPTIWGALGFAHLHLGHKPEALAAFNRAIENGSKAGSVWGNRAALKLEAESPPDDDFPVTDTPAIETAVAGFRQAIDLDPRCRVAYVGLSMLVYSLDQVDPEDARRLGEGRLIYPNETAIEAGLVALGLSTGAPEAEAELEKLLAPGRTLPKWVREAAMSMRDEEKMKLMARRAETLGEQHREAELITEIDGALADASFPAKSKLRLRALRTAADQARRLEQAKAALEKGHREEAADILEKLQKETPATPAIGEELERLRQIVAEAGTPKAA